MLQDLRRCLQIGEARWGLGSTVGANGDRVRKGTYDDRAPATPPSTSTPTAFFKTFRGPVVGGRDPYASSKMKNLRVRAIKGVAHVHDDPKFCFQRITRGTSLVAQWLRICLAMQGTRVRALVQEDPTCHRAAKPVRHDY